ncbi:regulatory protein TetR [Cryptobacterium sp. CAG:338]|nr:regulatory protein TetR [Cryptobacterium sp. CAG:338]
MENKEKKVRSKRDPQGRRRAIAQAAAELLLFEGPKSVTHRSVAKKAQVPLGSTTQYFSSINELKRAGYDVISRGVERGYDELIAQSEKAKNDSEALAVCIYDYVTNIEEVRADMVLSAAAIKDEELRALLERNNERYEASLKQYMSDNQAKMISVFTNGLMLETGIFAHQFSEEFIVQAVETILTKSKA